MHSLALVCELPHSQVVKMGLGMRLVCESDETACGTSSAGKLYGKKDYVEERHRHRYEVNLKYVKDLEEKGLKFVGHSTDGQRMEIMELKGVNSPT